MERCRYIVVKLEAARDERGMTVAELARRSDIHRKRHWYILGGQRQLRADQLVRFSLNRWCVRSGSYILQNCDITHVTSMTILRSFVVFWVRGIIKPRSNLKGEASL